MDDLPGNLKEFIVALKERYYSPSLVVNEFQKTDMSQNDCLLQIRVSLVTEVSPPLFGEEFCFFPCHLKMQHGVGWEILTTSSKVVKPPTTRLMILS